VEIESLPEANEPVSLVSETSVSFLSPNEKNETSWWSSSSSPLVLSLSFFFFGLVSVGFLVSVCGISGLFDSFADGLLGLDAICVILCLGFGSNDDRPDPI